MCSDSLWALNGCWALQAGLHIGTDWDHLDVWIVVARLLRARPEQNVVFHKVKSHVKEVGELDDIHRMDKVRNDAADAGAKELPSSALSEGSRDMPIGARATIKLSHLLPMLEPKKPPSGAPERIQHVVPNAPVHAKHPAKRGRALRTRAPGTSACFRS